MPEIACMFDLCVNTCDLCCHRYTIVVCPCKVKQQRYSFIGIVSLQEGYIIHITQAGTGFRLCLCSGTILKAIIVHNMIGIYKQS